MDETTVPTRERIVQAAIACFSRSGFHGASMQQICAEARISPGALYRHFPGKDTIIAAIAEAERTRHAAFFEIMDTAEDPVEAFVAIGIGCLEAMLAGDTNNLCVEITAEAIRNPEIRENFLCNAREARGTMIAAMTRGRDRGLVDPELDIEAACDLMLAMGDGLMAHQALNPHLSPTRFRPVLETMVRRLFRPATATRP
jgi:TetR/AcrR family transcriptional repressor of uid operon